MFGYIRAFKPYMRVYQYDIYKAVYCGLCKDMGRRFGFFTRFALSYDIAFLALVSLSVGDKTLSADMQRCVAHPFKKTMCADCKNDLSYSSSAAMILIYHKLKDDIADKGLKEKAAAMCALPFFSGPYRKAAKRLPKLAREIGSAMKQQNAIERQASAGTDLACEPTARMMTAIFGGLPGGGEKKALLERFGYLLGRFIYITDALDDIREDHKNGSFNPLLRIPGSTAEKDSLSADRLREIRSYADGSINLTLGELAEVYVRLDLTRYREILDNIIYLGLKNTYGNVRSGRFKNKNKRGNHIDG